MTKLLAVGFLASYGSLAFSKTVNLIDNQGNPITNAVIAVKTDVIEQFQDEFVIIDQRDKQFVPEISVMQVGQSANFPNSDNIRHHVYSFSTPHPFELKLYSGTEAPPVVFDKPGVVVLGCNIHDQMVGFIYIADNERVWRTDEKGRVTLPDDVDKVTIWHPFFALNHNEKKEVDIVDGQTLEFEIIVPPKPEATNVFGGGKFGG